MAVIPTPTVADVLRDTLLKLESVTERKDESGLAELKRQILLKLAELETNKTTEVLLQLS